MELKKIITEHPDVLNNVAMFKGILLDTYNQPENKGKINLILNAYEIHITDEIAQNDLDDVFVERMKKKLVSTYSVTDNSAEWAIKTWCSEYGNGMLGKNILFADTDIDFEDFFLHFREHDAEMSVVAVPYNVSIPLGILELDGRNIKGLLEKPKYNYYANAGIYLIKKSALTEIPKDEFFNATDLIEKLIAQGKSVIRYPFNGTWIDIGQHADLAKARDLVKHL